MLKELPSNNEVSCQCVSKISYEPVSRFRWRSFTEIPGSILYTGWSKFKPWHENWWVGLHSFKERYIFCFSFLHMAFISRFWCPLTHTDILLSVTAVMVCTANQMLSLSVANYLLFASQHLEFAYLCHSPWPNFSTWEYGGVLSCYSWRPASLVQHLSIHLPVTAAFLRWAEFLRNDTAKACDLCMIGWDTQQWGRNDRKTAGRQPDIQVVTGRERMQRIKKGITENSVLVASFSLPDQPEVSTLQYGVSSSEAQAITGWTLEN